MKDESKTKAQLIKELDKLRQRVASLEELESAHGREAEEFRKLEEEYRSLLDSAGRHRNEELRESEQRLSLLFEYAPDACFLMDLEGNFVDGNKAAEETSGYRKEELIGKNFFELNLLPADQFETASANLARSSRGEPTGPDDFTFRRKDGSLVELSIRTFPIKIKKKILVLCVARDITEHKRADEKLRESEERFRSITAAAKDAIIMMDGRGCISYWNPAAEEIFGYSREEALGRELHIFLAPERYHEAYRKGIGKFFETGKGPVVGKTLERMALKKDGTEFPVELSVSAVRLKGGWNAIGILRDITERKRAERALTKMISGFIPICSGCKRIRDEKGNWVMVETYIKKRTEAEFTHGICPDCAKRLYPEIY